MKKRTALIYLLAVVLCVSVLLSACGDKVTVFTEAGEWATDTVSRNKQTPTATLVPYDSVANAAKGDYKSSPYYMSLNGTWDFTFTANNNYVPADFMSKEFVYPDPNEEVLVASSTQLLYWDKINVPGNWELQGYGHAIYTNGAYAWGTDLRPTNVPSTNNEIGLYRRTVTVPADWDGREVYITLDGVSSACYVYVNGYMVGYGEDSFTSKTFCITPYLKAGEEALIAVKVYKYCYSSWLEAQDSIKLGGIFGDVYLYSAPEVQVRDVTIHAGLDSNLENAIMQIEVDVASYINAKEGYTLEAALYDGDGNVYVSQRTLASSISFQTNKTNNVYFSSTGGRLSVAAPEKWTAETPNLYTLVLVLKDGEENVVDVVSQKFGYVTSKLVADDDGFQTLVVNGEPVKLYGILYNEFSAVNGKHLTRDELIADILNLKAMNINAVRSPAVPYSAEFIQLCNEYGLYVVSDINVQSTPYSDKGDATIPGDQSIWLTVLTDRLYNLVERDKNNPSVLIWAIGNKSGKGTSFRDMRNLLTQMDDRMIIYDGDSQYSDIYVAADYTMAKLDEVLSDTSNKKQVLIQDSYAALLNGEAQLDTFTQIVDGNTGVLGEFMGWYADKALYWPVDGVVDTFRESPYEDNPALYDLFYGGWWGESVTSGINGLTGVLGADKSIQSDAYEVRNAYSPIRIDVVDLAAGKFTATNRNSFITFEDNYKITYEIYKGTEKVSSGTVSGKTAAPGESFDFTIDYGKFDANEEYFLDLYVKNSSAKEWDSVFNGDVYFMQFDLTGFDTIPKTAGADTTEGDKLSLTIVERPIFSTTAFDLISGRFYVTNEFDCNLNEIFDCTYELTEKNNFWTIPRPRVISSGSVNLDVPAYTADKEFKINYNTAQKAAEGANYCLTFTLTFKKDLDVDVTKGMVLTYVYDASTLGCEIPFETDPSRTPYTLLDEEGNPVLDEEEKPITIYPDIETEEAYNELYGDGLDGLTYRDYIEGIEDIEEAEYSPYITIENGDMTVTLDADNGMIVNYYYKGEQVLGKSPYFNLYRTPTGDDLKSYSSLSNFTKISSNSDTYKVLADQLSYKFISDSHVQITLAYDLATYDYTYYASSNVSSHLYMTYDIFGDGEIIVSYSYDPSISLGSPLEISNILQFVSSYGKISWYGRGPGESYTDKLASTRVGVYKDVAVTSQISDYLYISGGSDKTDVRWLKLTSDNGQSFLITSDDYNFDFNATKASATSSANYQRDLVKKDSNTYVRIISAQRGAGAGTIQDSNYYAVSTAINPGEKISYSYRIIPVTDKDDENKIAATTHDVTGTEDNATVIKNGGSYAIAPVTDETSYISSNLELKHGIGVESQYWTREETTDYNYGYTYRYISATNGQYLSPLNYNEVQRSSIEVGLGQYNTVRYFQNWQISTVTNNFVSIGLYWSLQPITYTMGSRVACMREAESKYAYWEVENVEGTDYVTIKNIGTGYYLTVVDNFTFRNALVEEEFSRQREYDGTINWSNFGATYAQKMDKNNNDYERYIYSDAVVTIWSLLPGDTQRWVFTEKSNGYYSIVNGKTGVCLALDGEELVEETFNGADDQLWLVIEDNGLYSFVNKSNNFAIGTKVVRVAMSAEERATYYNLSDEDAFNEINVLDVSEYENKSTQKWAVFAEEDLQINIEAGENWFYVEEESEE